MSKEEQTYLSADGKTRIHVCCWKPEGEVQAVLQISHGMTEYIERYGEFAEYLNARGILVAGNDHLGHGKSVCSDEKLGYFEKENGNRVLLRDIHHLRKILQKEYPEVPYYLLGHSMGSFLVRQYLCLHGRGIQGAIIMGTGNYSRAETMFGMALCRGLAAVSGWEFRSRLVEAIACGIFNLRFGRPEGKEWLSRNEENVARYVKDRYCTFRFTLNGYYNMFYSIQMLTHPDLLERMPKDLPVLFVSGEMDPVGQRGKGVKRVYQQFLDLGMKDVTCRLYPQDRHEILNEVDRKEVYGDIFGWIRFFLR